MRTVDQVENAFKDMDLENEELVKIAAQQSLLWEDAYHKFVTVKDKLISFLIKHPEFLSDFVKFDPDDTTRVQKVATIRSELYCSILDAVNIIDKIEERDEENGGNK